MHSKTLLQSEGEIHLTLILCHNLGAFKKNLVLNQIPIQKICTLNYFFFKAYNKSSRLV